jgi:hypothetical protein
VFVSFAIYVVFVEGFTYADNGHSFDGIFEANGLIFGILGHYGWVDYWECINRCYHGPTRRSVRGVQACENGKCLAIPL